MQEVTTDLWDYVCRIRCITTNGTVKKNGEAVMGRGCAKEAKDLFPGIARLLGEKITVGGNVPHLLIDEKRPMGPIEEDNTTTYKLISFPVKHQWYEDADLDLIAESARRLKLMVPPYVSVLIPRPGCGNGRLKWPTVKEVLAPILDTPYFYIVSKRGEK